MAFIKGKQLAAGTIDSREIKDSAITTAKLFGSIPSSKLDLSNTFDFSSGTLTVATPTQASHAATKGYVDSVKQALDIKESVRAGTTANLSANYNAGVLTATANGAITVDNVNLASGNRLLVKDQTTGAQNGIYTVTTVGDGSNAFVLTRADDFDSDADISAGAFCFVEEGTTNADYGFVLTTDETITLDTTALVFTQFSGAGQITAGVGITKAGSTISVNLDSDSGLAVSTNGLKIDASQLADGTLAVSADQLVFIDADGGTKRESVSDLASSMSGDGISASAGQFAVDPLATGGVEISANQVAVKLADSSVERGANGINVGLHTNGSIAIKSSAGLAAPIQGNSDLGATPNAVSADAGDTGIDITSAPAASGIVQVFVNGIPAVVGYGDKTKDCYFSGDAGTTARAIGAIAAGDSLFWNGDTSGNGSYALEATDSIDLIYGAI